MSWFTTDEGNSTIPESMKRWKPSRVFVEVQNALAEVHQTE